MCQASLNLYPNLTQAHRATREMLIETTDLAESVLTARLRRRKLAVKIRRLKQGFLLTSDALTRAARYGLDTARASTLTWKLTLDLKVYTWLVDAWDTSLTDVKRLSERLILRRLLLWMKRCWRMRSHCLRSATLTCARSSQLATGIIGRGNEWDGTLFTLDWFDTCCITSL